MNLKDALNDDSNIETVIECKEPKGEEEMKEDEDTLERGSQPVS